MKPLRLEENTRSSVEAFFLFCAVLGLLFLMGILISTWPLEMLEWIIFVVAVIGVFTAGIRAVIRLVRNQTMILYISEESINISDIPDFTRQELEMNPASVTRFVHDTENRSYFSLQVGENIFLSPQLERHARQIMTTLRDMHPHIELIKR